MAQRPFIALRNEDIFQKGEHAFRARDLVLLRSLLNELEHRRSWLARQSEAKLNEMVEQLALNLNETKAPTSPILCGRYRVVRRLEAAGMAEAYEVVATDTNERRFLKGIPKSSGSHYQAFQRELAIYEKLGRAVTAYVLAVLDFHDEPDYRAFVTEFADGGTLCDHMLKLPDPALRVAEAKMVAIQLAEGLIEIHRLGVIHRDIKPANIVKVGSAWKYVDFGISKVLGHPISARTMLGFGTAGYMAPEQFERQDAAPSADVYSFAKVLVFLQTGSTDPDVLMGHPWWPLVKGCTDRNPEARFPLQTALELLKAV